MSESQTDEGCAADLLADGVLNIEEAITFTKLSRAELYRQMDSGQLAFVKHGKRRLIPRRALIGMLAAGLTKSQV